MATGTGSHQAQPRPEVQANINAYWNQRSPEYDAQSGHGIHSEAERRAWLAALTVLLPPAPADVLDVGTGTGFLALLLAELGHRVTGVDLAEGMLALAREKGARLRPDAVSPVFTSGDAVAPPLPPASVDVVVSRHVLWTLTDLAAAFQNWYRLLRPGGRVVAIDGLWQLTRHQRQGNAADRAERWRELWSKHYTPEVQASLPLYDAHSHDPVIAAAAAAGFADITVSSLTEVEQAERPADSPRGPRQPRYVLTALRR